MNKFFKEPTEQEKIDLIHNDAMSDLKDALENPKKQYLLIVDDGDGNMHFQGRSGDAFVFKVTDELSQRCAEIILKDL